MNNPNNSPQFDFEELRKMIEAGIITQEQANKLVLQYLQSPPIGAPKPQASKLKPNTQVSPQDSYLRKQSSSSSTDVIDEEQLQWQKKKKMEEELRKRDLQKIMPDPIRIKSENQDKIKIQPLRHTKSQVQNQKEMMDLPPLQKNISAPLESEFIETDELDFMTAEEKQNFYRIEVGVPNYGQQQNEVESLKFSIEYLPISQQNKMQVQLYRRNSLIKNQENLLKEELQKRERVRNIHSHMRQLNHFAPFQQNILFPLRRAPNRNRLMYIAELANAPKMKILKYFGFVNNILCETNENFDETISWVLTSKNNVVKTIQFVLPDGQIKIELNSRQISKIVSFSKQRLILIIFDDPMRFFQKQAEIGWDRLRNFFASALPHNQLLLNSLIFKKQAILIEVDNLAYSLKKIREVYRRNVEQGNNFKNSFIQLSFEDFSSEYTNEKFQKFFESYTSNNYIKSWQIQFSLLSLLYGSTPVDLPAIFELAAEVKTAFNPFLIDQILKTVISLNGDSFQSELRQKKSLKEIFNKRLEQQKQSKNKDQSENTIKVPIIKVTPSGYFPAGWNYDLRSRLTRHFRDYDHQFLKIQVSDDDFRKSELYQCKDALRPTLQQLLSKIQLWGNCYIPLGWTQSQLKSKSMWFTLESSPSHKSPIIKREQLVKFLGNFDKFEKNPALKAARMGQNLSTGQGVVVNQVNYSCTTDDRPPGSNLMYTDGIGCISSDLVLKIQKQLGTTANIFQVRYKGDKGMLVINRELGKNTIIARQSMKKFECPNKDACKYLDILAENSFGQGYLNRQIIILLSANQISNEVLIDIQKEFIENELKNKYLYENFGATRAQSNSWKTNNGFFQLESIGEMMNRIIKIKPELIASEPTLRGILTEKHHQMFDRLMNKSQIKIEKAARLLGIIDQYGILKEYEVYCQIQKPEMDKFTVSGKAMLTKNPCMHQADIRVVNCISKQEAARRFRQFMGTQNYFDQLVNCVIFPKAGEIPLTAQISGSDLDGDQFYITWDERLVPQSRLKPNVLDAIKTTQRQWNGVGYDEMIKFFCEFIFNNELGRLANSHLIHADQLGVDCHICARLCSEYSKALDYPKKGYEFHFDKTFAIKKYPHWMQKPEKQTYKSTSVLGKLFDQCKKRYETFKENIGNLAFDHYNFSKFNHLLYSDKQIKSAYAVVEDFQYDIQRILRNNQLQRQSQVYSEGGSRDKQRDNALYMRNSLQRKYFFRFFEGLRIENAVEYYDTLRNENICFVDGEVEKKLMLWYQISNASIQKRYINQNKQLAKWINRLEKLIECEAGQIKVIGLPWFCVPFLTFVIVCQEFV